jgi:hypothetical protein
VSGNEVMKWLETWGTSNETKAPQVWDWSFQPALFEIWFG